MAYHEVTIYSYNAYNAQYLKVSPNLPDAGYPDNDAYLAVRNAAIASSFTKNTSPYYIGQDCDFDKAGDTYNYRTYRMTVHFRNALNIKAGAPIEYALLQINKIAYAAELAATYVVTNGQPDYPHAPPVAEDFDITHFSGNGGQIVNPTGTGWKDILLNEDGRSWINFVLYAASFPNDYFCRICLQSQDDIDGVSTGTNLNRPFISISGAYNLQPRLTIRITVSVPTVETDEATDISYTEATLNGEITHNGYWMGTYGFQLKEGLEGDITTLTGSSTSQLLSTYTKFAENLTPCTLYYYRAWCKNEAGTGYGEWIAFTTLCDNEVTTEPPTQVDSSGFPYYRCAMGNGTIVSGSNITERGFEIKVAVDFYGVGPYIWWALIGFYNVGDITVDMGQWTGTLTKIEYDHGTPYDPELGAYKVPLGKSGVFEGEVDYAFNDALNECESYIYRAYMIAGGITYYGEYVAFDTPCYPLGHANDNVLPIEDIIPIIPPIIPEELEPFYIEWPGYPPFELPPFEWPEFSYPDIPSYNGSWLGWFYYRKAYTKRDLDDLRKKCRIFQDNSTEYALVLNHNARVLQQFLNTMTEYLDADEYNTFRPIIPPQHLNALAREPLGVNDFKAIINNFINNSIDNTNNVNNNFQLIKSGLSAYMYAEDGGFRDILITTKEINDDNPDVDGLKKVIDRLNQEMANNYTIINHNLHVLRAILI